MNNPLLTEAMWVFFLDMNSGVEEQVISNCDCSFTIVLNSRLNQERQMLAYQHALLHIANDDFNKKDANSVELAM
ncbi:MAG TPA: hypothetical protein DEQ64_19545 [Lachnoclostridium sp.]|jgi:hypothetical protein|nr:hypothetical protein [Lachnoclostridium sp.]